MSGNWEQDPIIGTDQNFLEQAGEGATQDQKKWWHILAKQCTRCVGSGIGGGILAHSGCLITQAASVIAPAATAAIIGDNPVVMVASSLLIGSGSMGVWYWRSGQHAAPLQRALTIGGAFAGLIVVSAINLNSHEHHHTETSPEAPQTHLHHHKVLHTHAASIVPTVGG